MAYVKANGIVAVQPSGTSTWTKIPLKYIKVEEYKVTPDMMLDLDSYRQETGVLWRHVLDHKATKIEFTTPHLYEADVTALLTIIQNGYTDAKAHREEIRYYNPYTQSYKEATVYVPDIEFNINHIDEDKKTILYNPIRIAFIEY